MLSLKAFEQGELHKLRNPSIDPRWQEIHKYYYGLRFTPNKGTKGLMKPLNGEVLNLQPTTLNLEPATLKYRGLNHMQ